MCFLLQELFSFFLGAKVQKCKRSSATATLKFNERIRLKEINYRDYQLQRKERICLYVFLKSG